MKKHAEFVHLHNHTEYSLLDGACRILDDKGGPALLLKTMDEYGLPALAITDHGNMFGAIEFYQGCMKAGIKPIIGMEAYMALKSHKDRQHRERNNHLTLLAKNETGYRNLVKLTSISYLDGYYYKPRIDRQLLEKYSEGLVVLSGCLHGEIASLLLDGKIAGAKDAAYFYKQLFKNDYYFELMENGLPEQATVNKQLVALGKELDIPLVATNDCHYLKQEDALAHEILVCIGTASTLNDPKHMKFATDQFYYKSPQEMFSSFREVPDALKNTLLIAEKCNLEIEMGKLYLPEYKVPDGYTLDSYLRHLCEKGLPKRYSAITPEIKARLDHELKIISDMGYPGYFLIVWDFIHFAKQNGIPVGPGRGSGAGSIVSYLLEITEVNPLSYGLLFERFLNPSRVSMPDLDIDFSDAGRERVIEYVRNKYGADRVVQIITFGSMLAKGVIRDVGRVLSIPLNEINKICSMIPKTLGITLKQSLALVPELKSLVEKDKDIKHLMEIAMKLEGLKRNPGVHAAGIVIAKDDVTNYVPLARGRDDVVTTQYEGKLLEKMGLLKMDFLGLRTLTVIRDTVDLIKKLRGVELNIEEIPLDDKKTFRLLSDAKVAGVFQVEKSGMRDLLKKLKPKTVSDIIALIALYRPGPIGSGMLDDFVSRYHGKTKFKYEHPVLEKVLRETCGIIVYQEQVMQIATDLVGLSLPEADTFRAAMSKKNVELIEKYRGVFLEGSRKNGLSKTNAEKIFNNIKSFGEYGFNKSHAAAYGILVYRTAFLKANYSIEFFTSLLSSEIGHSSVGKESGNKIVEYISAASEFGISVLPPDINSSFAGFAVEKQSLGKKENIMFGLVAIKNVGEGAVSAIVEEREKNGVFKSLDDFISRIDVHSLNKRVLESLAKAGAFDKMLPARGKMPARDRLCANLEKILSRAARDKKDTGQAMLFNISETLASNGDSSMLGGELPKEEQWHEHQLLAFEKEVLGFYLSGHPLARYASELKIYAKTGISEIKKNSFSVNVRIAGIIANLRKMISKKKEQYARFKLEDMEDEIDVLVFPQTFAGLAKETLKMDQMVVVTGRLNIESEPPEVIAEEIVPFNEARAKLVKKVVITINAVGLEKELLQKLKNLLKTYKGGSARVDIEFNGHSKKVNIATDIFVDPTDVLISGVEKLCGKGMVRFA
ncbi:MAG: DNA polymerase III subunit alpha [Elusimicrobia bacterium ADurb.Bin231]|nr:MAG: DNA polymerase III subunit alpha [Elusimicrobia bacterium ADurb.Bin231]